MPLVASSCLVATSFQRVYGAVMTKSHFWASEAGPILTSRASPSKRSITIPFDSGKFLSGSASTTSPTVHFQPLAAVLYVLDLLTSSLKAAAHSSEKAFTAIYSPPSPIETCPASLALVRSGRRQPQRRSA